MGDVSIYYPGEAALALLAHYALTGEPALLTSARRAVDYLVHSPRRMTVLLPDAWVMQAIDVLYSRKPDRELSRPVLALARRMMAAQYGRGAPHKHFGGFGPAPRPTPAAARSEG